MLRQGRRLLWPDPIRGARPSPPVGREAMSIYAKCSCGRELWADDKYAGKLVRCPQCHQPLAIPDPNAATEVVLEEEVSAEMAAVSGRAAGVRDSSGHVLRFGMAR